MRWSRRAAARWSWSWSAAAAGGGACVGAGVQQRVGAPVTPKAAPALEQVTHTSQVTRVFMYVQIRSATATGSTASLAAPSRHSTFHNMRTAFRGFGPRAWSWSVVFANPLTDSSQLTAHLVSESKVQLGGNLVVIPRHCSKLIAACPEARRPGIWLSPARLVIVDCGGEGARGMDASKRARQMGVWQSDRSGQPNNSRWVRTFAQNVVELCGHHPLLLLAASGGALPQDFYHLPIHLPASLLRSRIRERYLALRTASIKVQQQKRK